MKYTTVVPAEDWFWITYMNNDPNQPIPCRVAVWALRDDDKVIGLINIKGVGEVRKTLGVECLSEPPDVNGAYKHLSQFTAVELKKVKSLNPNMS